MDPATIRDGPAVHRPPRAAAAVALFAGVLNLVSAVVPANESRLHLLQRYVPGTIQTDARVLTAAAGVGLVLLAGGLRRRQRAAYLATLVLLLGSVVLHVFKGLDFEEAIIEAFLAGLLFGKSEYFRARPAPGERSALWRPLLVVLAITFMYGLLGLYLNDPDPVSNQPLGFGHALVEVARLAIGLGPTIPLGARFSQFFPASVAAVFYAGLLFVVARALAPSFVPRPRVSDLGSMVAASDDSLAYFALRDDRRIASDGDAAVSYGPVGAVALAAGDPLGPPEHWRRAITAFYKETAAEGRVAAVIGCGAAAAAAYEATGLRGVYLGDEAVLDLDTFTLEGRARRIARQSWNRAGRAGWTSEVRRTGDLGADDVAALRALSRRWRGDAAERGFSMALGRLFDQRDLDTVIVGARDPDGHWLGFLHFVPWSKDGASLDVMRRERSASAILNDFLVVEAARRLPELGIRRMSLNFSFLRAVLAAGASPDASRLLRLERWALQRLSGPFQIETLYRFNRKFAPEWVPRYAMLEAPEDLPRVAYAALRAEGLLSLPRRRQAGDEQVAADQPEVDNEPLPEPGAETGAGTSDRAAGA